MGYTENIRSILQWANCLERQDAFPLDRTDLYSSYNDALLYAQGRGEDDRKLGVLAYIGQQITVWGPNEHGVDGVWMYTLVPTEKKDKNGVPYLAELRPVGGGVEIQNANTYSDAVALSEKSRTGWLIKVAKEEEVNNVTFPSGFYIVETPGTISALSTFSGTVSEENKASVQIQIDIEKLREVFEISSNFNFSDLGIDPNIDFTKTDICIGGYYPVQKKILDNLVEFYYYTIEEPSLDRISLSMDTSNYIITCSWTNVKITQSELDEIFLDLPS